MGYIPRPQTTQQQQAEQQQMYQQQFANAAYAAIPGVRPAQPVPPPAAGGTFNGQPIDPYATTPTSGWGASAGRLFGQIMPGIRSDWMVRNLSNADWQGFLPPNQGMQPGMAQNHMMPPVSVSGGRYGQQAAMLAGLLGSSGTTANTDGLLGGRPKGFRVPGGK